MPSGVSTAIEHYDRLLAEHYTWMVGGDIRQLGDREADFLTEHGLSGPAPGAAAVDLGCGPGAHALALARLGYDTVHAVDTSRTLLDELAPLSAEFPAIHLTHDDLRTALPRTVEPGTAHAILCMGDTLLHLPARRDVPALLADVAAALSPGGHFLATYRDLTGELRGTDRFLPVRADEDRILTCFLEYRDEDTVTVHDLLHARTAGSWHFQAGSYPKLRLAPSWLSDQCRAVGLHVRPDAPAPGGMRLLHATKP
ncbi:class I SAM-dependent methyltransferase [Streptomyces albiaxialis]|uniref:Class I SAM-dependent methyltransferase n=1 Tax=Streptomyces albiaxialis TaxID=329523 RepID=A0ABP5HCL9_9ACTN